MDSRVEHLFKGSWPVGSILDTSSVRLTLGYVYFTMSPI